MSDLQAEFDLQAAFQAILAAVRPVDRALAPAGQAHIDNLTKPQGSLGRLEELALQMFLAADGAAPAADPARVYTIAGDHGVVAEGVSRFPQEVTRQMVANFLRGGAGINALARVAGAELFVVDAGSAGGPFEDDPRLIQRKVGPGTANLARQAAMTRAQCLTALLLGVDLADMARDAGIKTLCTGDMGIGNTTPSTALYCAYLGVTPESVTGPGTGLDAAGVAGKAQVVARALELHAGVIASGDALGTLAALGGYEIAALAGLILGGAKNRQMVCVDGFISTAAFTAARALCPAAANYCVLSHASAEPGYGAVCEKLGLTPLLDLGMRLGEGTGAVLALTVLRAAAAMYNDMASFADAGVHAG
ncbi:MAG: nicotinate-nucleotide--dimethylbenzimidazole phosphoribosyltransferase [Desulfovibrionaceae bacterium]